tara:strand:+ start:375 stop:707 length:333 start_codon:yes stop_codon:yes gene_type:complete
LKITGRSVPGFLVKPILEHLTGKIRLLLLAQTLRQKTLCEQIRDESSSSEKNDADESEKNTMDLEFHKPEKDTDIRLQIRFSKVIASKSGWAYQLKTVLYFALDAQKIFS